MKSSELQTGIRVPLPAHNRRHQISSPPEGLLKNGRTRKRVSYLVYTGKSRRARGAFEKNMAAGFKPAPGSVAQPFVVCHKRSSQRFSTPPPSGWRLVSTALRALSVRSGQGPSLVSISAFYLR